MSRVEFQLRDTLALGNTYKMQQYHLNLIIGNIRNGIDG
jgi:hypothetical protein